MRIIFQFLTAVAVLWNVNAYASSEAEIVEGPVFYELPEMVVNLKSDGKAHKILKIKLNLELDSTDDLVIVEKIKPRMINEFQVYLRHLYADDFYGRQIEILKEELLTRANYAARPIKFKEVLFRGLLVQ
jgi:flagellar FliL protein